MCFLLLKAIKSIKYECKYGGMTALQAFLTFEATLLFSCIGLV